MPDPRIALLDAFENQQQPFDRIARLDPPDAWSWRGEITLEFKEHYVVGIGNITADLSTINGDLVQRSVSGHEGSHRLDYAAIVPSEAFGIARPASHDSLGQPEWTAGRVLETSTRYSAAGSSSTFTATDLTLTFGERELAFTRLNYRGIRFRAGRDATVIAHPDGSVELRVDSFPTSLFGRRARIRQTRSGESPAESLVSILISGPILTENENEAVTLLLSLLGGSTALQYASECFDEKAQLIKRTYEAPGTADWDTPNPLFDVSVESRGWDDDVLGRLASKIVERIDEGYPLGIAIHHLLASSTPYVDAALLSLTLCIQSLAQSHVSLTGKRDIISNSQFKKVRADIERTIEPILAATNEDFSKRLLALIATSNTRTDADALRQLFEYLDIELSETEQRALRRRNEIVHYGFIERTGDTTRRFQERVHEIRALRTLAHRTILRLIGYQGSVIDYVTARRRSV